MTRVITLPVTASRRAGYLKGNEMNCGPAYYAELQANYEQMRKCLAEVVYQFAPRRGKNMDLLSTGGYSQLQRAFDLLGWDDCSLESDIERKLGP